MSVASALGDDRRNRVARRRPPERLLEAFEYPGRQELAETLARHKDVPTNAETTAMYQEALCRVWDRRFATNQ